MKISYFRGLQHSNFGDALNPWMWPKLIPGFFDEDESRVFLGIGSILGEKEYAPGSRKIVFGSGYVPEYHIMPEINKTDWDIYFVRGPRTAKMLNLPPELGLGDPAILLRTIVKPQSPTIGVVSFMPHWQSMERGRWEDACRLAGINLIDPRSPVESVIEDLQKSKLLITEAMHGAIVADALRVPWVPVIPINSIHRGKWTDWTESLGLKFHPQRLWPSSLLEMRLSFMRRPITASPFAGLIEKNLACAAAHRLRRLSVSSPCLSDDRTLDRVTSTMQEMIARLRKDYGRASAQSSTAPCLRSEKQGIH